MNLTQYLFHRLKELGVTHTFGIPGDFVLPVYAVQEAAGMPTVVCAHEPGVGFAADAYARMKGLGAAIVTYGAGALNMVNPIACAYAEQSPVLVISGGPEVAFRRPGLFLHHVVGDFETQFEIYQKLTVDAAILDDPESAPAEIDRVLRNVVRRRRPGYLEIPRDRVTVGVRAPEGPIDLGHALEDDSAALAARTLEEATSEIKQMITSATRPTLYVGVGIRRFGMTKETVELAERLKLPVATDVLGKASFPESHPQNAGVYMGALGDPTVRDLLDDSDCVISLGVVRTDTSTGFWTQRIDPGSMISIEGDSVRVRFHHYDDLPMRRVVQSLLETLPPAERPAPNFTHRKPDRPPQAGPQLKTAEIIEALQSLDESKYAFTADVGDAWFIGLELRADVFLAPGFYASMGFAMPGALGAGIADRSRRPFVIVGDGAFQMTGTELATLIDHDLNPIVLLLNNSSYGMLEALDGHHTYYDRRPWNYPALAEALGCPAERVETIEAFRDALQRAEDAQAPRLIEAILSKSDLSPIMSRIRAHQAGSGSA